MPIMSPIDTIPSLIPLPAPVPQQSQPQKHSFEDEAMFDKFATLFNPPTPRASPILPDLGQQASTPRPNLTPSTSSDNEFGSFVSVPASQDPLGSFSPFEESSSSASHARNPSHDFFDKFAEDAKRASEKSRRDVLDELLLSENDPFYWPEPPQAQEVGSLKLDLDSLTWPTSSSSSSVASLPKGHHPSRSPTLSTAIVAPPLTTGMLASSPPTPSIFPPDLDLDPRPTPPPRSQSYQTLSNISAKWLRQPPPRQDTLQSIFNPPPPPPISHGTPFASHSEIFVPPTGAPGFTGDDHSWDKGYSTELERETTRPSTPVSVGSVIQKKMGYVDLQGRKPLTTAVLDVKLANLLRPHFPALVRLPKVWTLLYSLDQHGISLNTLYTRCETPKPVAELLIIQDASDALFGVYMGDGIRPSRGRGYYGSGESFMFKYTSASDELKVFKWTGRNDYVALCEPGFISFGGGDGQFGVYLDAGLIDGSSARCVTFGNEVLCGAGRVKAGAVEFECVGLEVWKIGA